MTERVPIRVFGIEIGTFEGWDESDCFIYTYYEFEPCPSLKKHIEKLLQDNSLDYPTNITISINYESGIIQIYVDESSVISFKLAISDIGKEPEFELRNIEVEI